MSSNQQVVTECAWCGVRITGGPRLLDEDGDRVCVDCTSEKAAREARRRWRDAEVREHVKQELGKKEEDKQGAEP